MAYDTSLPEAFPWHADVSVERARRMVQVLLSDDAADRFPNGTSFAVTSQTNHQHGRRVWLSEWSRVRLAELHMLAVLDGVPTTVESSRGWVG